MDATTSTPVTACIVTWNRPAHLAALLDSLRGQTCRGAIREIIILDNASDPPASAAFPNARIVRILDSGPEEPDFEIASAPPTGEGPILTVIRSDLNLGGCGGFIMAMLWAMRDSGPDSFLWLLDDDAQPAPTCLESLLDAMRSDEAVGIAGSRMVDPGDHATTLEGPVYLDRSSGLFRPEPAADRPLCASFEPDWASRAGGPLIDADIVAACSLLARRSVIDRIGLWDPRYFIAADDAEWCLRARAAGFRVVCAPGAVVFHAPWRAKRSPERDYYRRRNMLWMWQRHLPAEDYRRLARQRARSLLRQSRRAIVRGRLPAGEILRRTIDDAIRRRGGKLVLSVPTGPFRRTRLLARWVATWLRARRWKLTPGSHAGMYLLATSPAGSSRSSHPGAGPERGCGGHAPLPAAAPRGTAAAPDVAM